MTYLLQIQTKDLGLLLATEVTADTVSELQLESSRMVKSNPSVKGLGYRIFTVENVNGKFDSKMVKEGVISQ